MRALSFRFTSNQNVSAICPMCRYAVCMLCEVFVLQEFTFWTLNQLLSGFSLSPLTVQEHRFLTVVFKCASKLLFFPFFFARWGLPILECSSQSLGISGIVILPVGPGFYLWLEQSFSSLWALKQRWCPTSTSVLVTRSHWLLFWVINFSIQWQKLRTKLIKSIQLDKSQIKICNFFHSNKTLNSVHVRCNKTFNLGHVQ